MQNQKLTVYGCLLDYGKYRDRYAMFAAMAARGVDVKLLLLHGGHPAAVDYPENFHQLSLPGATGIFNRRRHIRELLAANPPGPGRVIVHDTFFGQIMWYLRHRYCLGSRKNARVVLSLFNPDVSYLFGGHFRCAPAPEYRYRTTSWLLRVYLPIVGIQSVSCHLADGITGNSPQIVEEVSRWYRVPARRTRFIPSEINPDFYTPGLSERKELNLPEGVPVLLYAGNFERRKGVDVFLRTVAVLAKRYPAVRAVLLGQYLEPCREWVEKLCSQPELAGRVEIRASVPPETLRRYYRSVDVLFFPTRHEGSPRVVKEALACGCPVVGPPIPPLQAVDPRGQAILYTAGYDPEECAARVEEMFRRDIREPRIRQGLVMVRQFTPDKIADLYLNYYEDVFGGDGG